MKSILALLSILALALVSCSNNARDISAAQTPGTATGAGATLTGPGNSATPSTQSAEREVEYYAPEVSVTGLNHDAPAKSRVTDQEPRPAVATRPAALPRIVREKVTTTLGQHQDAALIVRAASEASQWSGVRWFGLLCVFVGVLGTAYGVTHKETGYPVVFLKVAGIGVLLLFVAENPLWLLLLIFPLGFYAIQKLGVLRPLP